MREVARDEPVLALVPAGHRARAAHRAVGVEEGGAGGLGRGPLRLDDLRDRRHRRQRAVLAARAAVHRGHHEDRGVRRGRADPRDQRLDVPPQLVHRQADVAALVRAVVEHDEVGAPQPQLRLPVAGVEQREEVGRRAVGADRVVDDARLLALERHAVERHLAVPLRRERERVRPVRHVDLARRRRGARRGGADLDRRRAVHRREERSAAGAAEVVHDEVGDGAVRAAARRGDLRRGAARGAERHAGEAAAAVSRRAEERRVHLPAGAVEFDADVVVPLPRPLGQDPAVARVAVERLQPAARAAGDQVARHRRIAEMDDPRHGARLARRGAREGGVEVGHRARFVLDRSGGEAERGDEDVGVRPGARRAGGGRAQVRRGRRDAQLRRAEAVVHDLDRFEVVARHDERRGGPRRLDAGDRVRLDEAEPFVSFDDVRQRRGAPEERDRGDRLPREPASARRRRALGARRLGGLRGARGRRRRGRRCGARGRRQHGRRRGARGRRRRRGADRARRLRVRRGMRRRFRGGDRRRGGRRRRGAPSLRGRSAARRPRSFSRSAPPAHGSSRP